MIQEMWVAGLEWDELYPRELIYKSQEWFCELEELPTIKVPDVYDLAQKKLYCQRPYTPL